VNALLPPSISQRPVIDNPNLKADPVFRGLNFPTSMAFLGPNDILLLEKDNGTVRRIVNGSMLPRPLLHVTVASEAERGMLGIAIAKNKNGTGNSPPYIFLYYTESDRDGQALGNRLYRYELINDKLVNPKLLLSLPAKPGPFHNGGKIVSGPDNNVYLSIGDVFGNGGKIQNFKNGTDPDGRGGILRITQDGKPVGNGILGDKFPLNLYYAYGIRNSFGMDFDPVNGTLWDTENGPDFGDEINIVEPGFNSGWKQVQGIWNPKGEEAGVIAKTHNDLVYFDGKGKYRSPEFSWLLTVGPTALKFFNSDRLGKQYENDMFVGDFNNGNIYNFKLNQNRTQLLLNGSLSNKIGNSFNSIGISDWSDPDNNCDIAFRCRVNFTTRWNGNTSLQISTSSTDNETWSWIYGKDISVIPGEQYELVTHMKLNEFVVGSHVVLEGYNNITNRWDEINQITQCPFGTNGPLEWKEFRCNVTIPANTTKIRPILNAGWSSEKGKEAITLFDDLDVGSISHRNTIYAGMASNNLVSNPNFDIGKMTKIIFGYGFGHITDIQIGPDGYLYVLSFKENNTVVNRSPVFPYNDVMTETIYRIVPAKN
jgi:glucose/arabinose dehydrogenase